MLRGLRYPTAAPAWVGRDAGRTVVFGSEIAVEEFAGVTLLYWGGGDFTRAFGLVGISRAESLGFGHRVRRGVHALAAYDMEKGRVLVGIEDGHHDRTSCRRGGERYWWLV